MTVAAASLRGQANPQLDAVQAAVSIAEIQKTLDAIEHRSHVGPEGERQCRGLSGAQAHRVRRQAHCATTPGCI